MKNDFFMNGFRRKSNTKTAVIELMDGLLSVVDRGEYVLLIR